MPKKPQTWTREAIEQYKKDYEKERRKELGLDKEKLRFSKETIDSFTRGFMGKPARKGSK